ncbi:MAG: YggS family pyridoxal phosphate-dependent enzyme [bacterium]|nr:YggS family pyridoxal phosphate-dependent enzyme [bacterium]
MAHDYEQTDNHETKSKLISADKWGEDVSIDKKLVQRNLSDIKEKIAPCKPRIIGVTKYFGRNAIIKGYEAGLRDFGESRALESIDKINSLPNEIRENAKFHFIGHLQTNKADKVVKNFDYIHSVDSLKLAKVISNEAKTIAKTEKILLQVNVADEKQKFGYNERNLLTELPEILNLDSVDVIGLMTMLPLGVSKSEQKQLFSQLRFLRNRLETEFEIEIPELSMGMSDDYESAVEEGATMIRLGRKIFK